MSKYINCRLPSQLEPAGLDIGARRGRFSQVWSCDIANATLLTIYIHIQIQIQPRCRTLPWIRLFLNSHKRYVRNKLGKSYESTLAEVQFPTMKMSVTWAFHLCNLIILLGLQLERCVFYGYIISMILSTTSITKNAWHFIRWMKLVNKLTVIFTKYNMYLLKDMTCPWLNIIYIVSSIHNYKPARFPR